jgi:hypothetical protein
MDCVPGAEFYQLVALKRGVAKKLARLGTPDYVAKYELNEGARPVGEPLYAKIRTVGGGSAMVKLLWIRSQDGTQFGVGHEVKEAQETIRVDSQKPIDRHGYLVGVKAKGEELRYYVVITKRESR